MVAILGVKTGEELHALFTGGTEVIKRDINLDFFSNKGSLLRKIERLLSKGVLMDIVKLQDALKKNIGDITFSEAYTRTGGCASGVQMHIYVYRLLGTFTCTDTFTYIRACRVKDTFVCHICM